MIDLESKTITLGGRAMPILKFEVWFQTPFGLFPRLDLAIEKLTSVDIDVNLTNICPVSVAITQDTYELCGR